MRKEYDFLERKKNPYITELTKQVTIRLDTETIDYFKHLSENNGIPYQTLINLYTKRTWVFGFSHPIKPRP